MLPSICCWSFHLLVLLCVFMFTTLQRSLPRLVGPAGSEVGGGLANPNRWLHKLDPRLVEERRLAVQQFVRCAVLACNSGREPVIVGWSWFPELKFRTTQGALRSPGCSPQRHVHRLPLPRRGGRRS